MDLDQLQNSAGVTCYQSGVVLAITLNMFVASMTAQSGAMLSATPDHRCKIPFDDESFIVVIPEEELINITDTCEYSLYNYTICNSTKCLSEQGNVERVPCDEGWVYDEGLFGETTVSQWDLVCDRKTLDSVANAVYFLGVLVGSGVSGIVAGRFGRKRSLLGACWFMAAANVAASFSPYYSLYVTMRFLAAIGQITCYLSGYTLVQELIPTKYRVISSMVVFTITGALPTTVPGIMYAFKNWRYFYLTVGLLGLPFTLLGFVIPESPRWLLIKGNASKAKRIFERIFESKGIALDAKVWQTVVENEERKLEYDKCEDHTKKSYVDLFKYPLTRLITINVIYTWFVTSMVYYGLVLNITKLAGNPYVNGTINSSMNIVANFFMYFSDKFGRRQTLFWSFVIAGVCCLLSMILSLYAGDNQAMSTASVVLAILGKMFSTLSFDVIYVVTAEAYPTNARSLAMGIGSMAARAGSVVTPFTLELQYSVPWLTQTIFGVLSILAGISSLLFPETSKLDLITTLEETEEFYISKMKKTAAFFRITPSPSKVGITNEGLRMDEDGNLTKL